MNCGRFSGSFAPEFRSASRVFSFSPRRPALLEIHAAPLAIRRSYRVSRGPHLWRFLLAAFFLFNQLKAEPLVIQAQFSLGLAFFYVFVQLPPLFGDKQPYNYIENEYLFELLKEILFSRLPHLLLGNFESVFKL